jgi:hypothetical protein
MTRFRYLASILLPISALLAASTIWAADPDECEQLPKPAVTTRQLNAETSFNTEYSYRLLNNLAGENLRPGNQVLGLTRASAFTTFSVSTPAYLDATGRYECASPQITLSLGFKQMTVYVGKEFPVGSCAYKEILDHEMRHVKAYQTHIDTVEKMVQAEISRRFSTGTFWRGESGSSAARVSQELDERWLPYVKRELQKADLAQALIDTLAEYDRLGKACDGEVKKLAR